MQKNETGKITSYFAGVAKISGLKGVFTHELLINSRGVPSGLVVGFDNELVEAVMFEEGLEEGDKITRSGKLFSVRVSDKYLGRVVNGLGEAIDDLSKIKGDEKPVFAPAPQIIERQPVTDPLITGIKIIDATLPLGRGQRELLIGDRKLGKTTIAEDMVVNQQYASEKMICIFVICGRKKDELKRIADLFVRSGAMPYTVIVAATSDASLASQYLAPFVGCTIGEYFRDKGEDALIIYDDLTKHAKVYRDISLLLSRAPGREAYPGDIFTLHSKLLERSAKLSDEKGGGSLSAIPIIETEEGDITSFIPTNLISITDGQLYMERGLFQKGYLPAVNVGLSVSRVGSQAQPENFKKVTGGVRLALSQEKELQKLTQLETVVSREARAQILHGELILELLKQDKHTYVDWRKQTIIFFALENGFFDDVPIDQIETVANYFLPFLEGKTSLVKEVDTVSIEKLSDKIKRMVNDFKGEFISIEESQ